MILLCACWRPLVGGLAAAICFSEMANAQSTSIADRIVVCGTCHGDDGNSKRENIPSIAGQPSFFILNQLFLMREGVRKVEAMTPFVKDLKDSEIEALAAHYAKLTPKFSDEPVNAALVARGAVLSTPLRCGSCHMPSLAGQEQMPRLAKQRIDYMTTALMEFRNDKRSGADTLMSNVVRGLSDADLAALAHYAASKQ